MKFPCGLTYITVYLAFSPFAKGGQITKFESTVPKMALTSDTHCKLVGVRGKGILQTTLKMDDVSGGHTELTESCSIHSYDLLQGNSTD